jgi:bifunctional non-homologous end joining protein LigD
MTERVCRIGERDVSVTNLDKVLFPASGITKGQLIDHYAGCAEVMLPLVAGRALTLRRFPEGIAEEGWFQKHAPSHLPSWVARETLPRGNDGSTIEHIVIDGPATLVYLANLAAIELHISPAPAVTPDRPAELIFDLDPPPGAPATIARRATRRCHALLDELRIPSRVKTTGSSGFHIHVSLDGRASQDLARQVARGIATLLAHRHPDELTTEHRRARREGRVLVDWMRNSPHQTYVAPYSVRGLEGAPVATPMDWSELAGTEPQRWTITSVARRLAQRPAAWLGAPAKVDLHTTATEVADALNEAGAA